MLLTVGEKIRFLRKEKNLTQDELAHLMNLSKSAIAMYETNKNYPNLKVIKQLCQILETTGDFLIGLVDNPNETYRATNVYSVLNTEEKQLLSNYNKLNAVGKTKAQEYINDLTEQNKYTAVNTSTASLEKSEITSPYRLIAFGGDNVDDQPPIPEQIID